MMRFIQNIPCPCTSISLRPKPQCASRLMCNAALLGRVRREILRLLGGVVCGAGRGVAGLVKRGVGGGAIFMRVTAEPINISCAVFEKHSNIQEAYEASNARCTRERERGGGGNLRSTWSL